MNLAGKNPILTFILLWILIAGALFLGLYSIGAVPVYIKEFAGSVLASNGTPALSEFSRDSAFIIIPKIELTSSIAFPTSTDMAVLTRAVDSGPTHYPESALPGENGNVFIFGHSTSRQFVKNPAFTVFTKLYKLEVGDEIIIQSAGVSYVYRVTSTEIVKPDEDRIYLASTKPKLTLSTCWPVGQPTNRFVVEAEYTGKKLIEIN